LVSQLLNIAKATIALGGSVFVDIPATAAEQKRPRIGIWRDKRKSS